MKVERMISVLLVIVILISVEITTGVASPIEDNTFCKVVTYDSDALDEYDSQTLMNQDGLTENDSSHEPPIVSCAPSEVVNDNSDEDMVNNEYEHVTDESSIFNSNQVIYSSDAVLTDITSNSAPYDNFVSTFKKFLSSADDQCTINLTSSIALKATDNFVIPAGKQLTINLDGFTLSRQGGSGYLFTVEPEGTLIIGTSNMTPGTIDVGSSGLALLSRGSVGVYNGSIFGDLATENNGHLTVNCGAGRFSDSDAVFKYLSNAASGMKRVIFVDKNSIYEPRNYSGLMMAFEEVSDSNTKILLADDFEEGIIVESGKNVDIDLNGYTITQAWYESTIEIESSATITIRDSVGTGKIVSDYSSGTVIDNKGNLTICNNATVDGQTTAISNKGTCKIQGGTLNGSVLVTNISDNAGVLTMTDGFIAGDIVCGPTSNNTSNTPVVNISNGHVQGNVYTADVSESGSWTRNDRTIHASITITGGSFGNRVQDKWLGPSSAEALIDGTYYVGSSILLEASNVGSGSVIDVVTGDVTLTEIANGVTVKNSGQGIVSVNGENVEPSSQIIVGGVEEKADLNDLRDVMARVRELEKEKENYSNWDAVMSSVITTAQAFLDRDEDVLSSEQSMVDGAKQALLDAIDKLIKVSTLTISNTVNGEGYDNEKTFEYTIIMNNTDHQPIVDSPIQFTRPQGTLQPDVIFLTPDDNDGTISSGENFALKNGETITISKLEVGTSYTISQTNDDNYTKTVVGEESGIIVDGGTTVAYTNTYVAPTPSPTPSPTPIPKANLEALNFAIASALEKQQEEKLYSNFDAVESALAKAESLATRADDLTVENQDEINAVTEELNSALSALKYKPADLDELNATILRATSLDGNDYINYDSITEYLSAAQTLVQRDDIDIRNQDDIDQATENLNNALSALTRKANLEALSEAVASAKEKEDEAELYNNYDAVSSALAEAESLLFRAGELTENDQEEIDSVSEELKAAVKALQYKPVNLEVLNAAIERAKSLNAGNYANYDTLTGPLENAKELASRRDLDIRNQEEVNQATEKLNQAIEDLKLKADLTSLKTAVARTSDLNSEAYSNYEDVMSALATANSLIEREDELTEDDQPDIDSATQTLNEAINALVYKMFTLTISNNITGDNADIEQDFKYTITMLGPDSIPVSDASFKYSKVRSILGVITSLFSSDDNTGSISSGDSFILKSGERIAIANLKYGTSYTVTQTDVENYTKAVVGLESGTLNANAEIAYTNTYIAPIPEKADLDNLKQAVATADSLIPDEYKDFSTVQSALDVAKELLKQEHTLTKNDQEKIDAATEALNNAIRDLQKKDPVVDNEDRLTIDDTGTVKLYSNHMGKEEVKTIAVAFAITPAFDLDQVNLGFVFDPSISSTIKSAKQNEINPNLFTVRLAGTTPVFGNDVSEITLGTLTVTVKETGESVKSIVTISSDGGLKYVNGSELTADIEDVTVTLRGIEPPESTPTPTPVPAQLESLKAVVQEAESKMNDKNLYQNFSAVEEALAKAHSLLEREEELTAEDQDEINSITDTLTQALAELEYKPADTAELRKAIARTEGLNPDDYINYQDVTNALSTANELLASEKLDIRNQNTVDQVTEALNNAINNLQKKINPPKDADLTNLKSAVARTNSLNPDAYSNYEAVASALKTASELIAKEDELTEKDQPDIDSVTQALNKAIDALAFKLFTLKVSNTVSGDGADLEHDFQYTITMIGPNSIPVTDATFKFTKDKPILELITSFFNSKDDNGSIASGDMFSLKSGESIVISKLKYGTSYTVTQTDVKNYTKSVVGLENGTLKANAEIAYTNIYTAPVPEKANVDNLKKIVAEAEKLISDEYDDFSAVQSALDAAKELLERENSLTEMDQETINMATEALVHAMQELQYKLADLSKLKKAIERANCLEPDKYTDFSDVFDALTTANKLIESDNLDIRDQNRIDKATEALNEAIDCLEEKVVPPGKVDLEKLKEVISKSSNLNPELYEDFSQVMDALETANSLLACQDELTSLDQEQVDQAAEFLESAISGLKIKKADLTKLTEAIRQGTMDDDARSIYTEDSLDNLDTALQNALEICSGTPDITEQEIVDESLQALNEALANLKIKDANMEELNAALAEAQSVDSTFFTDDSLQLLNNAVSNARKITENDLNITDQDLVDAMTKDIWDALDNLKYKPADISKLNSALERAKMIATDLYTDDSLRAFIDALASANDIKSCETIFDIRNQAEVDNAAAELEKAMDALVENSADYSLVDEAIIEAQKRITSGLFTDESVLTVETAIAKVVRGLSITSQVSVNAMAKEIEYALATMKYKSADLTALKDAIANARTLDLSLFKNTKVFDQALLEAETLVDTSPNITQSNAIAEAIKKLTDACSALVYKDVQIDALNTAIAKAQALDATKYKDFSGVVAAVDNAKALLRDGLLDIRDQQRVDQAVKAIVDAINSLVPTSELRPTTNPSVTPDLSEPPGPSSTSIPDIAVTPTPVLDTGQTNEYNGGAGSPQTGDNTDIVLLIAIMLLLGNIITTAVYYKKKSNKN